MKRYMLVAAVLAASGTAAAAPFVYPAKWTVSNPSEVRTGGTYRTSTFSEYKTLNPFTAAESQNIPFLLGAGAFFTLDPSTSEYIPYMAENYTVSANKLVWTLNLRSGMKWSDGKPIVADDFVTAARIHMDEDVGSNSYDSFHPNGKPVKVEKVDNDTVRVTFPSAKVDAIELMADTQTWPQPAHVFGPVYSARQAAGIKAMWTLNENAANIVSSGPFKLESYRNGERVAFVRNEAYGEWNKDSTGKPLPYLGGYTIAIVKDNNAQLAQYLAGNLDTYAPATADQLAQIKRAIDGGQLRAVFRPNFGPAVSSQWIVFNWNRKSDPFKQALFRNVNFRRAMSHLANRAAMIDIVYGGLAQPAYSGVYAAFRDWQSPNLRKYDFNVEAASRLLAEIGFSRKNAEGYLVDRAGKVLEFDLNTNAGNNQRETMAKIFSDEAKKAGVKVNFRPIDFNSLVAALTSEGDDRKFDAILLGLSGGGIIYPLGDNVVPCGTNLHAFNTSGKCIAPWETQVSALFFRGQQEFDFKKRVAIAQQIQDIESQNQGWVYLVSPTAHVSYLQRVRGEFPTNIASTVVGTRDLSLTWLAQ